MVATPPERLAVLICRLQASFKLVLTPLADEFGVGLETERGEREIVAVEAALRQEGDGPCGVELAERLDRGDAQLLRLQPAEESFGFDDALERSDRFGRVDAAECLDGFDAKVSAAAGGKIAVHDGEEPAESFAITGDADFVDGERHDKRIDVIEDFKQDTAASG